MTNERPGIEDCVPYCGKVALITRADGNCRFSAELYSALAVAVQEPDRFISFWGKLAAVRTTSPYGTLGPVEKVTRVECASNVVDCFVSCVSCVFSTRYRSPANTRGAFPAWWAFISSFTHLLALRWAIDTGQKHRHHRGRGAIGVEAADRRSTESRVVGSQVLRDTSSWS